MDKTVAGLIGAVSALAASGAAHATAAPRAELAQAMQVNSYADLLKPIPNALALQAAFAEAQASEGPASALPEVMTVQYYHHHHHHHHRYYRRHYHHHHHHHHRRGIGIFIR